MLNKDKNCAFIHNLKDRVFPLEVHSLYAVMAAFTLPIPLTIATNGTPRRVRPSANSFPMKSVSAKSASHSFGIAVIIPTFLLLIRLRLDSSFLLQPKALGTVVDAVLVHFYDTGYVPCWIFLPQLPQLLVLLLRPLVDSRLQPKDAHIALNGEIAASEGCRYL